MVINFFKEKERLKQSLQEAQDESERLRAELEQERRTREEAERKANDEAERLRAALEESERKYQSESEARQKAHDEAESLREELKQEQEAHKESERMYQAEVEDRRNAQEDAYRLRLSLEREQKAREKAERKLQAESDALRQEADNLRATLTQERKAREEAERKCKAEAEHLRTALEQERKKRESAERQLKAIEDAKPVPNSMKAKLVELLKTFEALPYPENSWHLDFEGKTLLPITENILRIKTVCAMRRYLYGDFSSDSAKSIAWRKCEVLYVLVCIAEGVSANKIRIDDDEKLLWNTVNGLIDKMFEEYISEHPEDKDAFAYGAYSQKRAKNALEYAFTSFPAEIVISDKKLIDAIAATARKSGF